jgi:ATP-dependent Clp protease protease subunit
MTPFMKFRMANKGKGAGIRADGSVLWLYDVIASDDDEAMFWGGISPNQFIAALSNTTGPVTLRINSPGGSVFGAQAMVAAMRAHAEPITARVDSLAASAASVIATEAASLEMVQGAMLMVHRAWGMAIGNEQDMRETADLLAKIDGTIADTYARRTGKEKAEWLDIMAAETWFDAQEAVAAGLADTLIEENLQRPAAQWDLSAYKAARWQPEAEELTPAPDVQDEPKADLRAARQRQLAARLAAHEI